MRTLDRNEILQVSGARMPVESMPLSAIHFNLQMHSGFMVVQMISGSTIGGAVALYFTQNPIVVAASAIMGMFISLDMFMNSYLGIEYERLFDEAVKRP